MRGRATESMLLFDVWLVAFDYFADENDVAGI